MALIRSQMEKLEARIERLEKSLQHIQSWANAYPVEVFPEPDLMAVRELLKANGMTLDSVAAHCYRHCLKGIKSLVDDALKEDNPEK